MVGACPVPEGGQTFTNCGTAEPLIPPGSALVVHTPISVFHFHVAWGEGLGCPWVSASVNNEVGSSGWKKGYFHCSSDVTFSTGFFPQDSFSYFLFRFPAPHSSFGILDIVLFFSACSTFPLPQGHQKIDSWRFLHPPWHPAPAFTDIHSPRMSRDSPWADYLPPSTSLHLCLNFCPANWLICTIFLRSTYMH